MRECEHTAHKRS